MLQARSSLCSRLFPSLLALSLSTACSEDTTGNDSNSDAAVSGPPVVVPAKLAIVADWLNQSLSYVDVEKLGVGGSTREAVVTSTLALPDQSPGPLEIELTPDRKTALISISAGFFSIPLAGALINESSIPSDPGRLLFLDVESGKVTGELVTGESPIGIAITPDGSRAFVANFGSGDMGIVDIASKKLLDTVKLDVFAEEISFDDSGTVGLVGDSASGSAHAFSVADPRGTLSAQIKLKGDSAGIAFFPGTKLAFMVQAPNPLSLASGFSLIDLSNPQAPVVVQDERLPEQPTGYPAVSASKRQSVLVPVTVDDRLVLREYKLVANKAVLDNTLDIAQASLLAALGIAYDGDHGVLLTWPGQRALVTVDLDARTSRVIPWLPAKAGPAAAVFR